MQESKKSGSGESTGGGLGDKLLRGVASAVELRIVTIVSEVTVDGDFAAPKVTIPSGTHDAIATSISLASGDITSVVPERFWAPDRQVIRDYHQHQVDKGHEIVERNIRLIGEVGSALAKALGDLRNVESKGS